MNEDEGNEGVSLADIWGTPQRTHPVRWEYTSVPKKWQRDQHSWNGEGEEGEKERKRSERQSWARECEAL